MLKIKSFFGDRAFYRRVFAVAIPIMIQNGITNFVSLLDNIMVGQVGTVQMNGVAIANQLVFVFNLCIFGAVSGAGIFTAQFYGSGDQEGIKHTFRFKLISSLTLAAIVSAVFVFFGPNLISLFLQGEGDPDAAIASLGFGYEYLLIMLVGMLPFAITNTYSSTLRETGQTVVPMVGGVTGVVVNLALNYVLIFGKFGAPALGVSGAAVATVVSRYVELAIIAGWTHKNSAKNPYIKGAYRSLHIPGRLVRRFFAKGTPLLANEFLWSLGVTFINQCYSTCGQVVVSAQNISTTINNLASVVFLALGVSVGIIIGQLLGAGESEEVVRDTNKKLITTSVISCLVFGGLMASVSGVFPLIYNTEPEVRHLATQLICICAVMMPMHAFVHASYFTIRSSGQTFVTLLFDSGYMWGACVPVAFVLSAFTDMPIIPLYSICQGVEALKVLIAFYVLKKGKWIKNLTTGD